MKKILTILAASAMFFAFGEDISNGINFEAYTAYGEGSFDPLDKDPGTQDSYWYSASGVGNVISNHVAAPVLPSGVTVPDLFKDDNSNTNFLYLETESPLFRTVKTNTHVPAEFDGVSILDNPIYLDTLVKFTAADSAFTSFEDAADKIAIEYVEHEEESHEDPEHGLVIDSAGFTNFVIRAGYLSSPLSQTNYYAAVPADFDKDAWHRLTVRSFGSIDTAGNVGFVVYLDGVALEYDTNVDVGPGFTPSGAAAAFYTESLHALFPSAVQSGGNKSTLSAVAFSGNGSIDDVVFTTTMPEFIRTSSLVRTEITIGTGVTDVTAMVAGTSYEAVETNNTLFVFNLPALTTEFVLNVTADTANGYTFNPATCITASNDVTYVGATITITGGSPALTVVGKRDNAYYMDGETKVGFDTLSEAISSAPANATIKLGYNYSVTKDVVSDDAPVFVIAKNVVLDLNGKELDGGSGNARALFSVNFGCVLTVIDSVPGDGGSIIYGGTFGMFAGDGDTIIGSDADYGPVIIGAAIGDGGYISEIVRGKFSAAENTTADDEFVCGTDDDTAGIYVIADDSTFSRVGDYWVVEPKGGSTTFALTTTGGANATITTDPANVSALTEETEVTITSTPETGYTYNGVDLTDTGFTYDSESDTISKTLIVSADTEVAVPGAVSQQQSGYDSGDGEHTFVIDSATEDELEDNLPTGKTLASPVSEGSSLTYAQAYALGLWDENATDVAPLNATIAVGADGKVTVTLANAPTSGYLVQCKVYEKASLTAEWPSTPVATYAYGSEQAFTPASATAGFYKVAVVITNSLQQ